MTSSEPCRRDRLLAAAGVLMAATVGCSPVADDIDRQLSGRLDPPFAISNVGDETLEGHTPHGFAGSGVGLFAGDNLNRGFPEGEGVQLFVAFELPELDADPSKVSLRSDNLTVRGDPFVTLGSLRASPVSFESFGPQVFDSPNLGDAASCELTGDPDSPDVGIDCDVTVAAVDALGQEREVLQFRVRFDESGDGDGAQDLALFFLTDSNTNEPGIFSLVFE